MGGSGSFFLKIDGSALILLKIGGSGLNLLKDEWNWVAFVKKWVGVGCFC